MKVTRSPWILLAGLTIAGAANANPPRAGGVEAYVNAIEGTNFSTTTRLKGEVLFRLADTLGASNDGESDLYDTALRYAGEFGALRVAANGGVGYHENPGEHPDGGDESSFYRGGLTLKGALDSGQLKVLYGLGVGATYYDEEIEREGDDNWIYDVSASVGFTYQFNKSWRLDNYSRLYTGGHGSTSRGYFRGGVLEDNVVDFLSDTKLHGRADGQGLGSAGVEWTSSMTWGGYASDETDELDSHRLRLIQEFRYNFDEDTTVFVEGAWGFREWEDWSPVDSTHIRIGGGVRGSLGGLSGELKGGYHMRDYDDLPGGDEDRDVLYVEGNLNGTLADGDFAWGVYGLYGLQDLFPGEGGEAFVDPEGFRGGLRAVYRYNETVSFTSDWTYSVLESNDFTSLDVDVTRLACGIGCEVELNDRFAIGLSGNLVNADYDSAGDDTFWIGALDARIGF